jgi:AraC-like DNA-binding protein
MSWFLCSVLLVIGFSIGAALLLAAAFASTYRGMAMPPQSRVAGYVMLIGLALTQLLHARYLAEMDSSLVTRGYILVVVSQSVGFYWLFLGLLRPLEHVWLLREWLVLPAAVAVGLAIPLDVAIPVVLLGGTAGAVHLGLLVYRLRAQRRWFLLEFRVLMLFALFALIAAVMAAIILATPGLDWRSFATGYALLIGAGFALVLHLLLRFPDIVSKTEQAVANAYAVTTLSRIDREKAVAEISRLFEQEKIYQDENLSLARLAELTQLSAHQVSELVNTEFEVGFSRLVRQYRVEAAKKMLMDEPRASVLSVGLSVGFSSQSNFYVAFKEITGVVPGQFRKQAPARRLDSEAAAPK